MLPGPATLACLPPGAAAPPWIPASSATGTFLDVAEGR